MKEINNINPFLTWEIPKQFWWDTVATYSNKIDTTPITEEILLEMSSVLQKESMKKLVKEVLEVIEKNNITELLVYNSWMLEKWKMILHY